MPIRKYKPVTPSRRSMSVSTFEELTRNRPERALLKAMKKRAGRNSSGRITVRHHGGGNRRKYRCVDFKRDKTNIPAKVISIEYDPNRSANIALLHYADGEKRYILAPNGLELGREVKCGRDIQPLVGNTLPVEKIPLGMPIHNVELVPGGGGALVRAAGLSAVLLSREGNYANIKLPSGELRLVNIKCLATIGQVGNVDHESVSNGKAGHSRWMGIRPTVRGRAMNPIDHPHGGGEGKSTGGHPRSPWGQYAKGYKTRHKHSRSNKFIISRRK